MNEQITQNWIEWLPLLVDFYGIHSSQKCPTLAPPLQTQHLPSLRPTVSIEMQRLTEVNVYATTIRSNRYNNENRDEINKVLKGIFYRLS